MNRRRWFAFLGSAPAFLALESMTCTPFEGGSTATVDEASTSSPAFDGQVDEQPIRPPSDTDAMPDATWPNCDFCPDGGAVICDTFDRPAPEGNGWTYSNIGGGTFITAPSPCGFSLLSECPGGGTSPDRGAHLLREFDAARREYALDFDLFASRDGPTTNPNGEVDVIAVAALPTDTGFLGFGYSKGWIMKARGPMNGDWPVPIVEGRWIHVSLLFRFASNLQGRAMITISDDHASQQTVNQPVTSVGSSLPTKYVVGVGALGGATETIRVKIDNFVLR